MKRMLYVGDEVLIKKELMDNSRGEEEHFPFDTEGTVVKVKPGTVLEYDIEIKRPGGSIIFSIQEGMVERKYGRRTFEHFKKYIEDNNLGYRESANTAEFMKGVAVAYSWLCNEDNDIMDRLFSQIHSTTQSKEYYEKDLKMLCEIVSRHAPEA